MTQEEMRAILEEFKSGLPVGITKEQMESTITTKMAELTAKFEATASKEELLGCKKEVEVLLHAAQVNDIVEVCSTQLLDFDQHGTVLEGKAEYICKSWK